ncbi:MAG: MBL fold metallo-hydrolase [Candidatus Aminicenantales bacterium]
MKENLLKAYAKDINTRINRQKTTNPTGWQVHVHEVSPGLVYEDTRVAVTAFPVSHGSWWSCYGYRFETPDLSVVISGDTAECESLIQNARGCDVLIHEAYCMKNIERLSEQARLYVTRLHTSSTDLGRIANRVKPKLLILYHQLHFFGSTEENLLAEVRSVYSGKVVYGKDLDIF